MRFCPRYNHYLNAMPAISIGGCWRSFPIKILFGSASHIGYHQGTRADDACRHLADSLEMGDLTNAEQSVRGDAFYFLGR
ncbi:MAG: hypothetical protein GPOALKHO_000123 [Sodalis sp.]|nr:MAG: hypothetical protein GPOALKHO_000123 [Sodalis sp.]